MKNQNGFVFMESIIVLVVVAFSLTMLLSSYNLVSRKTKEKEFYDKASDKYLLYSISNLGTDDKCNYSISCPPSYTSHNEISFRADDNNCKDTKIGDILYDCEQVFKDLNIKHIYVVENILNDLNDYKSDGTKKSDSDIKANQYYDNGTVEYLKTLKKCNDITNDSYTSKKICNDPIKYMVGVFERGINQYYYASIELD